MPAKDLIFDAEARRQLKSGIDALANAVKVTLGPRGRNVAIDKKWGPPTVTHDGVTVAKEIELENPFQNMGAQMLKQATEAAVAEIKRIAVPVKGREDLERIAAISANDAEIGTLFAEAMEKVG